MASKYVITAEQKAEIEQARKANKDKRIEAKLKVLVMRADGIGAKEISEATEFHPGRLYFAVFHAMRAVLALDGIDRKHHSGIISEFRRLYVKTGIFDREASGIIASVTLMRHDSDYDDYIPIEKEDLEDMLPQAEKLITSVKEYLEPIILGDNQSTN